MKKNVNLNEIPLDLFMEYFSKEDLAEREFEPKIINPTLYTYEFSISGETGTFFYKTYKDDFDDCKQEIVDNEFFGSGISTTDLALISTTSEENKQLYYSEALEFVISHKYSIELDDGTISTYFFLVEIDTKIASENIGETILISNFGTDAEIITGTLQYSTSEERYFVQDGTDTYYIIENEEYDFQEIDNEGYPIFIDEYGNETRQTSIGSNFLRHSNAIKIGFGGIKNIQNYVFLSFSPGTAGVVNNNPGQENNLFGKNIVFYNKYENEVKINQVSEVPLEETAKRENIDRTLLANLNNGEIIETLNEFFYYDVLDIGSLQSYKASGFVINDEENLPSVGETIILNSSSATNAIINNVAFEVNKNGNTETIFFRRNNLFLTRRGRTDVVRLPILKEQNGTSYIEYPSGSSYKKSIAIERNGFLSYNIGRERFEQVNGPEKPGSLDLYNHGYIEYPIKKIDNEDGIYFGTVDSINGRTVTIAPFQITESDWNSEEPEQITTPEIEYIQDILDPSVIVKKEKTFIKDTSGTLNEHLNKTFVPELMNEFSSNGQYIINGFREYRGAIVPSGVIKKEKRKVLNKMAVEFIEKRFDNFLIMENPIYGTDAFFKMRIFAEGYQNLVKNDFENLREEYIPIKRLITVDDLNLRVISAEESLKQDIEISEIPDIDRNYVTEKNSLNVYQRLLDYEKYPSNSLRKKDLELESVRRQIHEAKKLQSVLDEINIKSSEYNQYNPSKSTYKQAILGSLVGNFYSYNNYSNENNDIINDKFTSNYDFFSSERLESLKDVFINNLSLNVSNKKIYTEDILQDSNLEGDFKELLDNIFINDWRVI